MSEHSRATHIELRPSYALAAILMVAHAVAISIVVIVAIPPGVKLLALAALGVSAVYYVRVALLIHGSSIVALEIAFDDTLSVHTRTGDALACEVQGSSYVNAFLAVINLTTYNPNRHKHVVVLPDSIDPEQFRKLRVWLRWKPRKPEQSSVAL
jgi:toxin CptA